MKNEYALLKNSFNEAYKIPFPLLLLGCMLPTLVDFTGWLFNFNAPGVAPLMDALVMWSIDLFLIAFVVVLNYCYCGKYGVAAALFLGLYFKFYTTVTFGFFGYIILAILLAIVQRALFSWNWSVMKSCKKRISKMKKEKSAKILGILVDLFPLTFVILILPGIAALLVGLVMHYAVAVPWNSAAESLGLILTEKIAASAPSAAPLLGAMVGFDLTGPIAKAAWSAAVNTAYISGSNAIYMTIYGLCVILPCWGVFVAYGLNVATKRKWKYSVDDFNHSIPPQINLVAGIAKRGVYFSMPILFRYPYALISYVAGTSAMAAMLYKMEVVNSAYMTLEVKEKILAALPLANNSPEEFIYTAVHGADFTQNKTSSFIAMIAGSFIIGILFYIMREISYRISSRRTEKSEECALDMAHDFYEDPPKWIMGDNIEA